MIIEKKNYDDVFLRNVTLGLLSFLDEKVIWTNNFEGMDKEFKLPIHLPIGEDVRFDMDSFYDDIIHKKIHGNTDVIPRGVLSFKNCEIKIDEFQNPNIWLERNIIIDEELHRKIQQCKRLPVKLTYFLDVYASSTIELFKLYQIFLLNIFMYKYFIFEYQNLPITASILFIQNMDKEFGEPIKFGDVKTLKKTFELEIETFLPIFDKLETKEVIWTLEIFQNMTKTN